MRRAIVKSYTSTPIVTVVPRICFREGCNKELTKTQKKYCSGTCRNLVLSPGNNGGAPTKYKSEFAGVIFEKYIDYCEKANEPLLIPTKSSYIVMQRAQLPSQRDYSRWLWKSGYSKKRIPIQTFNNWYMEYDEFALTMNELKEIQKEFLINNSLAGRYNPTIAKMLLNANHGMVERKEVDNNHKMLGFVKHIYQRADEIMKEKLEERKSNP